MTKSTITRERIQRIIRAINSEAYDEEEIREWLSSDEIMELSRMALAAMDSESGCLPLDYLQGHKDGLEWAAQLAEANHPETGDWLYDDPIDLAKAIRKGPDMPPAQPVADSEPVIVVGDDGGDALSYRRLIQSFEPGTKLYRHAQPAPVYPETLPCPVLLEPGLRFGKGIKTSTMLAALARRDVYESDLAALSPEERAVFQAGIEGVKALIAQPAPVVPKSISVRQAISALESADAVTTIGQAYKLGWNACRAAMLQELQKSAGTEATCRSNENVQVLHTKSPAQSDCCPAQNSVAPAQSTIDHGYRPGCECSGCKATARICADLSANSPANPDCWCRTCRPVVLNDMRFVVCPDCGNKRCPRANDHRNACTGSNEPGQEGSAYPADPQEVKGE